MSRKIALEVLAIAMLAGAAAHCAGQVRRPSDAVSLPPAGWDRPENGAQDRRNGLPDAPRVEARAERPPYAPPASADNVAASSAPPRTLTRTEAEQFALKNNPRISVAALLALAQRQVVRETRSYELPNLNGNLTGVDAEEASRISSGTLNASRLLYHAGAGVVLNQLITDFGRTRNLVASSSLQAKASEQSSVATRADIAVATDIAFYRALEAQATLAVAQSTVNARQTVSDQVSALTASKLKSTLDQSFAEVNLSQAKLLALDAQNQYAAAIAALNEVLGTTDSTQFHLVDDPAPPAPVAASPDDVIAMALQRRPDLLALRDTHDADVRFAQAQHDQLLPTISASLASHPSVPMNTSPRTGTAPLVSTSESRSSTASAIAPRRARPTCVPGPRPSRIAASKTASCATCAPHG
jgi:outer membrane protein